ncbi:MAG: hypothetical protein AB1480_14635 [Nitrospirota bacterium]
MREDKGEQFYEAWETLPEEIRDYLKKAFEESLTEEQFISAVMVGECPKCGSANTVDCDEIQGIEDATLGLCRNCGYFWCLECGSRLTSGIACGHWKICDECGEEKDEFGDCGIPAWECEHIEKWLEKDSTTEFKNTCAWCGKTIPENSEVFGLGAKIRHGFDIKDKEGKIIQLSLVLTNKTVPAIVTTSDSEAKREGYDLMFMTCSQRCAKSLKKTLQKEKEIIDRIS